MKNFVAAFLCVFGATLALSTTVQAQTSSYIGIRLGADFASQSLDKSYENATSSPKFGILGGAQFDYWFSDMLGISAGLLYDMKGTHEEYSPGSQLNQTSDGQGGTETFNGNDDYSLGYLDIPILLKVAFGEGDFKPYLFAGPEIGVLLSASNSTSSSNSSTGYVTAPAISDLKSSLNSTDVGVYFGAGLVDRMNSGTELFFDAGYSVGLTKVYKSQPTQRVAPASGTPGVLPSPIDHTNSKSSDIRIAIGMMWPL